MMEELSTIQAEAHRLRERGYSVHLRIIPPGERPGARRTEPRYTDEDERCARWLFGIMLNAVPRSKQPTWRTWFEDVRKMREIDGRTHKEICELFRWAQLDDFWCSNILSPGKLREKWDQLSIKRARTTGAQAGGAKFTVSGNDRTADRAAQEASMARRGVTVPDGEVGL
jgi:hypothetical protein